MKSINLKRKSCFKNFVFKPKFRLMHSSLSRDSQIEIAKAISKGTADKNFQKIGLTKRNINQIVFFSFLKLILDL